MKVKLGKPVMVQWGKWWRYALYWVPSSKIQSLSLHRPSASSSSSESFSSRAFRRISNAASMIACTSSRPVPLDPCCCCFCTDFCRRSSTFRSWIPAKQWITMPSVNAVTSIYGQLCNCRMQQSPGAWKQVIDWLSRVQRPTKCIIRHIKDGFLRVKWPKVLKEVVVLRIGLNPTRSTSPCYNPTHACNIHKIQQEGQHELTVQRAANFRRDLGAT